MYEKYPKRGAWTEAACLMTLIFHPVSADVYMLVHPHTLTVSWPLCALLVVTGDQPSTWSVGVFLCRDTCPFEHRVSCLHMRIRRESLPLCHSSMSLCGHDSLCDT